MEPVRFALLHANAEKGVGLNHYPGAAYRLTVSVALILAACVYCGLSRPALADSLPASGAVVVTFNSQGTQTQHVTQAQTVGDFLKERGISPKPGDYVRPALDTPLIDDLQIEYSPLVPVRLITASANRTVLTTATDVGALLEEQNIHLDVHDVVHPSLADPIVAGGTIRITRIFRWTLTRAQHIAARTIRRVDFSLPPGTVKVVHRGTPGLIVTMVDFTQTDGTLRKRVVSRRLVRKPQARIIAEGVGSSPAIAQLARRGLEKTAYIAAKALDMMATAYTARCAGCNGYTASGYRAGRGIVAVDPRVIPLGSKLFIPGYGFAIAGDTGGAIVGNRIDLGFGSVSDAMSFGRRMIKVFRLK